MTPTPGVGHNYIQDLDETVNPANGSVSIRIAAPTPIERGLNQPVYAYMYDTAGQIIISPIYSAGNANTDFRPILSQVIGSVGVGYQSTGGSTITQTVQGTGAPGTLSRTNMSMSSGNNHICAYSTNYIYTDTSGGRHPLGIYYVAPPYQNANSCGYFGGYQNNITSGGDGIISATLDPNNGADVFIYDAHGNQLNSDYKVEDTNGNYLNGTGRSYSGSYIYTYGPGVMANNVSPSSLTIPGLGGSYTYTYPQLVSQAPPAPVSLNGVGVSSNDSTCAKTVNNVDGGGPLIYSTSGPTVITLPNGQKYTITFDPNYGLVNKITYPTGATVIYTWKSNTKSDSIYFKTYGSSECGYIYDMPAVDTRTVSYDGTAPALKQVFTYSTTWGTTGWTSKTTTVQATDLIRNTSSSTVYTYLPTAPNRPPYSYVLFGSSVPVENTATYYDTSGAVLRTETKVWSGYNEMTAECTTLSNGQIGGTFYQYGTGLVVTDKAEYDYGLVSSSCVQPSTTPTRETLTTYQAFTTTPIHTVISDRPSIVTVKDHGTVISQTTYAYDQTSVASVSKAVAHDEANYGPSSTAARGNLTSVTVSCLQSCSSPATTYTYDETGQVVTETDPKGYVTSFSYTDAYSSGFGSPTGNTNTYLTQVTRPTTNGVAHLDSYQYGFNNGKMTSHLDQNKNSTGYCYQVSGCTGAVDPWARLRQINNPDGGVTTISYSDAGPQPTTTTSVALSSGSSMSNETIFDAYGHTLHSLQTSDPSGTDIVDTTYDGLGRPYTVTNPYRGTSTALTTYTYDALGRMTNQQNPDSTSKSWLYSGNVTTFTNELSASWQSTSDALGRLTNVTEPNGASTGYSYDALNNLTNVTQNGLSGETPRTSRTFTYDSLSRLLCASNPENATAACPATATSSYTNGTVGYTYDANGNLSTKEDARGITTTYNYDALNRLLSKTYPAGTASSCYQYDQSSLVASGGNLIGRLTNSWTQTGSCPAPTAPPAFQSASILSRKSILAYDAMGRMTSQQQCTKSNCNTSTSYSPAYTYDLAGNLITHSSGIGSGPFALTFTNGYDGAGHLCSVLNGAATLFVTPQYVAGSGCTSANPTLPGYSAAGGLTNATFGTGLQLSRFYDNRLRISSEADTGNATPSQTPGAATITISGTDQTH